MSMFAKLLGGTAAASIAAAPAVAADAGAAPAAPVPASPTEAQIEAALVAAKAEGVNEGIQTGAADERARTAAVLGSEAGQKNMSMAAFMLDANPTATAEAITTKLGAMPAVATAAAAEPAKPAAVTTPLAEAPKVDLGGGKSGANDGGQDGSSKEDATRLWDGVIADIGKNGVTAGGMRGAAN